MTKRMLLELIENFIKETWKYDDNVGLDNDMEFIYEIESKLRGQGNIDIEQLQNRLIALMGILKFKYGFESVILKNNLSLAPVKRKVADVVLSSKDVVSEYNEIKKLYEDLIVHMTNVNFIIADDINENVFLAVESLKSLITNLQYRRLLNQDILQDILVDIVKLINGKTNLQKMENKYWFIIKQVWAESLSNNPNSQDFRLLFSNISGDKLSNQASRIFNRPDQSSCSMISSNFVATYGSQYRRIGFIYPNNSSILMASPYDLGSNVFGTGVTNRELGTTLLTPEVLEKIGLERAIGKGEDVLYSTCYNEILVDSLPSGILIIGFGEKDLNVDYDDALNLARELDLPIYEIDMMKYENNLSEFAKDYIAYHSVLSYMNISTTTFNQLLIENRASEILQTITNHRDEIVETFIELKKSGVLSKETMLQNIEGLIGMGLENGFKMQ